MEPLTVITSLGSHWAGEDQSTIDELLTMLAEHPLDKSFERYGNFVYVNKPEDYEKGDPYPRRAMTRFFGNFLHVSFVFNIDTDDATLIERLTSAIRKNQLRPDYLNQDPERAERIREYEAKRHDKAARFEQCAENAERRAAVAFDCADLREEKSGIPLGQPILVGHHSERRHRRALERADNAMRKGIEESEKAKYYARRADNAANSTAIMSDDPAADTKLAAQIAEAEKLQAAMKACNAAIRQYAKAGPGAQVSALVALGRTEAQARRLIEPDFCGRIGFPDYALTNNGANIRRMKERLKRVTVAQATPATVIEGSNARLEDCPADNRVRLFFPGKPSEEIRSRLKSSGFRWSPTIGAWQAYRNWSSIEAAKREAGLTQATA